ncbi:hypothetical protein C8J57DRAFT_1064925, partial [Mycena rebaudengoi]
CYHDRAQLGCELPGECIETARILLDSIMPKWNPTVPSPDLCDELELTAMEREENTCPRESDRIITFNPDFTLSNMRSGFRIFAFEESLNDVAARRYKVPGQVSDQIKIFIHARILHPGEYNPIIQVSIKMHDDTQLMSLSFDRPEILSTFS